MKKAGMLPCREKNLRVSKAPSFHGITDVLSLADVQYSSSEKAPQVVVNNSIVRSYIGSQCKPF